MAQIKRNGDMLKVTAGASGLILAKVRGRIIDIIDTYLDDKE